MTLFTDVSARSICPRRRGQELALRSMRAPRFILMKSNGSVYVAVVFAALNEPEHLDRGGAMFSELLGCRVWKDGKIVRRVRSLTIEPLYMRGLIAHEPKASGDRKLEITMAGYDTMQKAERGR